MSDTMQAMIFKNFNDFQMERVPKPKLTQPDELLVKVLACSICGTDVNLAGTPSSYGSMNGRILGHEIVGEVVQTGSNVTRFSLGDRVVVNPNSYCGVCCACRQGYVNHCENMELMGLTHPGGFAQYTKVYERMAFSIAKELPLHRAVFAEPLACALNGFRRLTVQPGDTLLQIGCGPIGLLFAQLGRLSGARVICLEPKTNRRQIAERLGFTVFDSDTMGLKEKLIRLWGKRADYCIDTAGSQLAVAVELAEYCGTILCFARAGADDNANLRPIGSKELTIYGSFIIKNTMPKAIQLIESGVLELDAIVTHVLPLEQLMTGIELIRSGTGMKVILKIPE